MPISMNDLNDNERLWMAKAIVRIVLANNTVGADELNYVKKMSRIFMKEESKETISLIGNYIKNKEKPTLNKLEVGSADKLLYMLSVLAESVFADGRKAPCERDEYFEAGMKLGLGPGTLSYRLTLEADRNRVERKLIIADQELLDDFKKKYRS